VSPPTAALRTCVTTPPSGRGRRATTRRSIFTGREDSAEDAAEDAVLFLVLVLERKERRESEESSKERGLLVVLQPRIEREVVSR